jgi:hypothetical protein
VVNLLETCYALAALSVVALLVPALRRSARWSRILWATLAVSVLGAGILAWYLGGF